MSDNLSQIELPRGRYVLAVSGGVDSVSLLDLLSKQPSLELIVAHFNHGIRNDADEDEQLVKELAENYGVVLEIGHGKLGQNASEEKARDARYKFLDEVQQKHGTQAIVTAHHQDDLIETAFLNLLRGSGRRGLSAIKDSDVLRPLLGVPKEEIIKYAQENGLKWREDSTNSDPKYLRNYLRQGALSSLDKSQRRKIVDNIENAAKTNQALNQQIATLSQIVKSKELISRAQFINLPSEIADELVMHWLREGGFRQFDRKTVQRLSLAIKTGLPGTKEVVARDVWLEIDQKTVHFTTPIKSPGIIA